MSRLRAGAAIAATIILSITALASCQSGGPGSPSRTFGVLDQPVDQSLRRTLRDFKEDAENCRAALSQAGVQVTPLPDSAERSGCALTNGVKLERASIAYSDLVRVSCPMAAALSVWERRIVAPAAARHLGSPVVQIEIIGSYSCRTRNSKPGAPMSEHATGDAADIAGFRLKDGRLIMVEQAWGYSSAESAFLHDVRNQSCRLFNAVLSPDYNWAHRNHLHFDLGRDELCR